MSTAEEIIELTAPQQSGGMQRDDDGVETDAAEDTLLMCPPPPGHEDDDIVSSSSSQQRDHGPCDKLALYVSHRIDDIRTYAADTRSYVAGDLRGDLGRRETYGRCLWSCAFFFLCHALATVLLHICFCCTCLKFCLTAPSRMVPRNRAEEFFAFFAKQLSNIWVAGLLVLVARWILFQPFALKPHLGVSTVHELELLLHPPPPAAGKVVGDLRFNVTTYLLFKNEHDYYKMGYKHLAVSVWYAGEKLGPVDGELPSFKQKPHRSTVMRLVFAGRLRNASDAVAATFAGHRDEGMLRMAVRIRLTQAYKFWPFKPEYFAVYDCPLISPFPMMLGKPGVSSSAWCNTIFTA